MNISYNYLNLPAVTSRTTYTYLSDGTRLSVTLSDGSKVAGVHKKKSRVTRDSFERKTGLGPATSLCDVKAYNVTPVCLRQPPLGGGLRSRACTKKRAA